MVARSAARSPSPHTPGARMTVVTLTPSNNNNNILVALSYIYNNNILVALEHRGPRTHPNTCSRTLCSRTARTQIYFAILLTRTHSNADFEHKQRSNTLEHSNTSNTICFAILLNRTLEHMFSNSVFSNTSNTSNTCSGTTNIYIYIYNIPY